MKNFSYLIIWLSILIVSCEKDEISFPVTFSSPIIHGYIETNESGDLLKVIGSNDLKLSDRELPNIHLVSYPNPCHEISRLHIGGDGISKKIWVVAAMNMKGVNSIISSDCLIVNGKPIFTLETTFSEINIDLSKYEWNYYRVFVKINNILFWNNIIKN